MLGERNWGGRRLKRLRWSGSARMQNSELCSFFFFFFYLHVSEPLLCITQSGLISFFIKRFGKLLWMTGLLTSCSVRRDLHKINKRKRSRVCKHGQRTCAAGLILTKSDDCRAGLFSGVRLSFLPQIDRHWPVSVEKLDSVLFCPDPIFTVL